VVAVGAVTRYVRINAGPVWHIVRDDSHLIGWSEREWTLCGRALFETHTTVVDTGAPPADLCRSCAMKERDRGAS
jgi:hypothetical protein